MKEGCPDPEACRPLTCFACGACVRVAFSAFHPAESERFGAMGLREGALCTILQNADKLILGIGGCRLGVPVELAMQVFAHEVPA